MPIIPIDFSKLQRQKMKGKIQIAYRVNGKGKTTTTNVLRTRGFD